MKNMLKRMFITLWTPFAQARAACAPRTRLAAALAAALALTVGFASGARAAETTLSLTEGDEYDAVIAALGTNYGSAQSVQDNTSNGTVAGSRITTYLRSFEYAYNGVTSTYEVTTVYTQTWTSVTTGSGPMRRTTVSEDTSQRSYVYAVLKRVTLSDVPTWTPQYVAPVYKGTDNNPTNGIDHWVTNDVPSGYTVVGSAASRVTWGAAGATRWYVVKNGTFQIDGGVACAGHVNLVLCDGAKLTVANAEEAEAGIATDANGSFTIYGTPDGAGELSATGGGDGAGIGGSKGCNGENIVVNGGTVTATSGSSGAGLGGGSDGNGKNIVVNGGVVTATGGEYGAGLGGGVNGAGENIAINGGLVFVTCDSSAECIGSGSDGEAASGVSLAPEAKVLFNLVGSDQVLPATFAGFVVLTPETPVTRVLVGGISNLSNPSNFTVTNAVTAATTNLAVNGESVLIADDTLLMSLPHADSKLTLTVSACSMITPPSEVAHTTAKVYVNDAEIEVGTGVPVAQGTSAYVVYTADAGYNFADGSTAATNALDTTKNPATVETPEAPHAHKHHGISFARKITCLADFEALCAAGGSGFLAADLAVPTDKVVTVSADVQLCLAGHAFAAGDGTACAFGGDAVTLTYYDCTNAVCRLATGSIDWPGFRLEGPGTFTDEADPSILVTTNGYRAFDNGDSTWTAALAWPVQFVLCDGTPAVATNYAKRGEAIAKPAPDPTRDGWAFDGWYADAGYATPCDFAAPVTGELTLYAKWATPGAGVENADGEIVPAKDFADAADKAQSGGVVIVTNETPTRVVDKELVVATDDASKLDGVTAGTTAAGRELAKTNSVGDASAFVVIGQLVDDRVTVIRERKADVLETPAPAGVADADWAVVSALASEVSQSGIFDALAEETKTNLVKRATTKEPDAEAVVVTINLDVTPKDVKKEGGSYVKYTYDAQPVATVVAVKNGVTNAVASGVELEAGSDFVKDAWFQVALPCAGMMPVAVMHKLSDGSFDEYTKGDGARPSELAPTKTFAHDAVNQRVTFWTQENSEFSVMAVLPTQVTLTYDALGGAFAGGADAVTATQLDIETYAFPEAPTRAGYTFAGWCDGVTNGAPQVAAGAAIGATSLFAKWTLVDTTLADAFAGIARDEYAVGSVTAKTVVAKTDLVIPDRVADGKAIVEIGRNAFTPAVYAGKVTRTAIGTFVTVVRPYAFYKTALTNATFAVPHDYLTGAKTTLELQDYAFAKTKLTTLAFPAGGTYRLGNYTFYGVGTVEDVYFYGALAKESWDLSPFHRIGRNLGVDPATGLQKKVKFHLNPSQAADAKFVAALTNGVDNACVQLDQEVLGTATTGSFEVGETEIVVAFTPAADSPWQTVSKDTVYLLYSGDVTEVVVGTGKVLRPTQEVVRNPGGSYTATFEKPAEASGFFRVCVGN